MGAANDPGVGLTGKLEIVGVSAVAADQRVVFFAADRLTDTEFCSAIALSIA